MTGLRRIAMLAALGLTGCAHGFGYPAGGFLGLFGHDQCADCYQPECESCATCEGECASCGPGECRTCDEDCLPCRTSSHCGYQSSHDLLITGHYARRCSRRSIEAMGLKNMPSDFRDGFEQAYEDIADGQSGAVPAIPPEKYWTAYYRSAEGKRHAQLWFEGYRAGSASALGKKDSLYGPVADSGVVYDPDPVPPAGVRQPGAAHPQSGPVIVPPGWQPQMSASPLQGPGMTSQYGLSSAAATAVVPRTGAADASGRSWSHPESTSGSQPLPAPQSVPQHRSSIPAVQSSDSQAARISGGGLRSLADAGIVGHGIVESMARSGNTHTAPSPNQATSVLHGAVGHGSGGHGSGGNGSGGNGSPGYGPAMHEPVAVRGFSASDTRSAASGFPVPEPTGTGSSVPARPFAAGPFTSGSGLMWSDGTMHPTGLSAYHNYRQ